MSENENTRNKYRLPTHTRTHKSVKIQKGQASRFLRVIGKTKQKTNKKQKTKHHEMNLAN